MRGCGHDDLHTQNTEEETEQANRLECQGEALEDETTTSMSDAGVQCEALEDEGEEVDDVQGEGQGLVVATR